MYIGGLNNSSLRANLVTTWQNSNYLSIIALQNDVAKNNLWRSTSILTLHSSNIGSDDRKNKGTTFTPCFKKSNCRNGNLGSDGNKC
jgi:hypothetical protein